ncbi:MAG: hypothetical protein J0H52_12475 [Comamonadaceae bacterium]|nr:hypothetical protein [Comamonadaceae bacterium]
MIYILKVSPCPPVLLKFIRGAQAGPQQGRLAWLREILRGFFDLGVWRSCHPPGKEGTALTGGCCVRPCMEAGIFDYFFTIPMQQGEADSNLK